MTDFGASIDRRHPLPLHPNPLFQRDSFLSLNGEWEFAINREKGNVAQYDETILVPFAPETPLSGIQRSLKPGEYLHYRRKIELPDAYVNHDILLHLDAVDQICDVFWNGHFVAHHEGGYFPLEVHLTCVGKEDVVEVVVSDDTDSAIFPRGKQTREPGGVWYTPTSGIWQSVWLESVPDDGYIQSIKVDPLFDEQKVKISAKFIGNKAFANAECFFKGQLIAKGGFSSGGELILDLSYEFFPWNPNEPNLYELTITAGYDSVHSYFAMRKVSAITIDGFHLFALNNHPFFLSGVLDQGYFPESGLTAPNEEAVINDLMLLKKCGYNTVRKHIKIEPMRWYYQCDRLGLLVCQDFVNGGSRYSSFLIHVRPFFTFDISDKQNKQLGRLLAASRNQFLTDMKATIDHLYNVPSIVIWTIFNEGWGQFDTDRITDQVRELDPTRLLDSSSGWYDKRVGDFKSEHIYFWYFLGLHNDRKRILALTEFGGYSLTVPYHDYSDTSFGYYYCRSFQSFNAAVMRLYRRRVLAGIEKKGLSEAIFTQLSDVEEEQNGLITYDRKVVKIDTGAMKEMNKALYHSFERKFGKME